MLKIKDKKKKEDHKIDWSTLKGGEILISKNNNIIVQYSLNQDADLKDSEFTGQDMGDGDNVNPWSKNQFTLLPKNKKVILSND